MDWINQIKEINRRSHEFAKEYIKEIANDCTSIPTIHSFVFYWGDFTPSSTTTRASV
jgi:hypothetical protein